jgi:hypothetical protein
MKRKHTKTEKANLELNKTFYDDKKPQIEMTPFINNNQVALVLSNHNKKPKR